MKYSMKYILILIFISFLSIGYSFEQLTFSKNQQENYSVGSFIRDKRNKNSKDLSSLSAKSCDIELLQCKEDEICKPLKEGAKKGVCSCKDGWQRDIDNNCKKFTTLYKRKSCEVGLLQCAENEKCNPINERTRNGICQCRNGFQPDNAGHCKTIFANGTSISSNFSNSNNVENLASYNLSTTPTATEKLTSGPTHSSEISVSPSVTKTLTIDKIIVDINNKTIELSEGASSYDKWTTLSAYAIGGPKLIYKYGWNLISKPESKTEGTIRNVNTQTISLSNLIEGIYVFKVSVTGENAFGEATGNITVIPAKHKNEPPKAVIMPASHVLKLPNAAVIFDGSGSSDDDKIVSYQWELIMGPIGYKLTEATGPTLQMNDPIPGNYSLLLKVKDAEGLEGNTTASLVVIKETDYPPTANAGGDKIIYMPMATNDLTLYGNSSTDDHGIEEWEWTKGPEDSGNAVDMQDTRTPFLHLSNLEEGHYHFILKVIDTAKQTAESSAHVYVHSSADNVLDAQAGKNITLVIPKTSTELDGSNSKGISTQTHYLWRQLSGPQMARFNSSILAKVNVTGLTRGTYVFQLVIWNEDITKNSSSNITVTVIQDKNAPPIAKAGGDFSVVLPNSVVVVNGSSSSDDVGITKWLWQRDSTSLAAGTIIKKSDHSPVLLFTGVVPGRYVWNLTVWDDQGSTSTDSVSIIVKNGPNHLDEVEIVLGVGIENLSFSQLNNLLQKLKLLLQSSTSDVNFDVHGIQGRPLAGKVSLILLGYRQGKVVSGPILAKQLKTTIMSNSKTKLLDLPIIYIDTVVCQNDCSGHGECIQSTRECRCHSWWMESSFKRKFGDRRANCDWSVIYVFVGAIGTALLLGACLWMCVVLLVKNASKFQYRKHRSPRYSLLEGHEETVKVKTRFPGTLLDSGSDSESESEILFDTRKRQKNDKMKNGHIKMQRIRT